MSVFSTNQARHLFVVEKSGDITASALADGTIYFEDANNEYAIDKVTNILSASATKASSLARPLNAVKITGVPEANGTYTLGITYSHFVTDSDESLYHEWASAKFTKASATATAEEKSNFFKALAMSLAKNTAKQGMITVYVTVGATTTEVKPSTTLTGTTYDGIILEEKEQPWVLGTTPQTVVNINKDSIIATWATVENTTAVSKESPIGNGKSIADLEYFCLGERGDQYRGLGWPYVTPTKGKVNPDEEYDIIDIHYAYVGANESVQKSEKTLTFACVADGSQTIANALRTSINTAAGKDVVPAFA